MPKILHPHIAVAETPQKILRGTFSNANTEGQG